MNVHDFKKLVDAFAESAPRNEIVFVIRDDHTQRYRYDIRLKELSEDRAYFELTM